MRKEPETGTQIEQQENYVHLNSANGYVFFKRQRSLTPYQFPSEGSSEMPDQRHGYELYSPGLTDTKAMITTLKNNFSIHLLCTLGARQSVKPGPHAGDKGNPDERILIFMLESTLGSRL